MPESGSTVEALDHDFHVHGIVPSVALLASILEDIHGSFYRGKVVVTCKDKVTQPSSALRHATELTLIVTTNCSTDGLSSDKPVLVLVTDGGPDHRLTFASVKIALLLLFISLDLDMLVAVRTCPYQSWANLGERVMSTLNLALQNVSLAQKRMSEEAEASLQGKNTLADIRAEVERNLSLIQELQDSISHPIITLTKCFTAMELKDEPFFAGVAATGEEIQAVFERVHFIDPDVTPDNLKSNVLQASRPLQFFLEKHSHA